MARPSIDRCDDGWLVFIKEATHWVQHEEPARVNELIREFSGCDRREQSPYRPTGNRNVTVCMTL